MDGVWALMWGMQAPPAVGAVAGSGAGAGHLLVVNGELWRQDASHVHQVQRVPLAGVLVDHPLSGVHGLRDEGGHPRCDAVCR